MESDLDLDPESHCSNTVSALGRAVAENPLWAMKSSPVASSQGVPVAERKTEFLSRITGPCRCNLSSQRHLKYRRKEVANNFFFLTLQHPLHPARSFFSKVTLTAMG